ncbi:MAG: metal-dependent hydrolase [Gammaproteobacteria bacterium]|nr:metal-dependent hydrolase [Gammaproteobacteria bacterium]
MDLLTQGLVGTIAAQSGARQDEVRTATWVGFLSGLLADADILIRSAEDPLLNIEYHRHFTHSVFFVPFGALLAALLLWPFLRRRLSPWRLYLFTLLGFSLSGFLDACTSYGTHLFWPLLEERIAWQIISIIDPLFSLTLLVAAVITWRKRKPMWARVGLVLAGCYLLLGLVQHQRAAEMTMALAEERGHQVERMLVKPTLGNLVLWRSLYESKGSFHIDAVRVGLGEGRLVFPGGKIESVDPDRDFQDLPDDSVLLDDIKRFGRFSDQYLAWHPDHDNVLGDVRYANLPTGLRPLWGIEIDPLKPAQHARYSLFRDMDTSNRRRFVDLLLNRKE